MGGAGGCDDSVAGVAAGLLARGRFAGVAVGAVLRLVGRGGERAVFVPGSVLTGGSVLVSLSYFGDTAHILGVSLR